MRTGENLRATVEGMGYQVEDRFSRLADVMWHTWPRELLRSGRRRRELSLDLSLIHI